MSAVAPDTSTRRPRSAWHDHRPHADRTGALALRVHDGDCARKVRCFGCSPCSPCSSCSSFACSRPASSTGPLARCRNRSAPGKSNNGFAFDSTAPRVRSEFVGHAVFAGRKPCGPFAGARVLGAFRGAEALRPFRRARVLGALAGKGLGGPAPRGSRRPVRRLAKAGRRESTGLDSAGTGEFPTGRDAQRTAGADNGAFHLSGVPQRTGAFPAARGARGPPGKDRVRGPWSHGDGRITDCSATPVTAGRPPCRAPRPPATHIFALARCRSGLWITAGWGGEASANSPAGLAFVPVAPARPVVDLEAVVPGGPVIEFDESYRFPLTQQAAQFPRTRANSPLSGESTSPARRRRLSKATVDRANSPHR
jgi:hypothetical protein